MVADKNVKITEQAGGLSQINISMCQLFKNMQMAAIASEQLSLTSEEPGTQALQLMDVVRHFNSGDNLMGTRT